MTSVIPDLAPAAHDVRCVVLAGASGLIGQALGSFLRERGVEVRRLVRGPATREGEIQWNPAKGALDAAALEGVDGVINLAGENVGAGRWTARRRTAIRNSRIDTTRTLVRALGEMKRRPRVLINASAVGFYGNRGNDLVTERDPRGEGFLADVCVAWEAEAMRAAELGVRVVLTRFGVVLSAEGGALAKMLPLFRLGLGGRLGRGDQWMSWIGLADVVAVLHRALVDPTVSGPLNASSPQPVTNREFTRILGRVLRRPAAFPVPAFVLRTVFGEMADATLLSSTRVIPERLRQIGFRFELPELEGALSAALRRGA